MEYICFYHSADLDGKCGAAVVKQAIPRCVLYPINYNDEFPFDMIHDGMQIIMVDFSLQNPFSDMFKIMDIVGEQNFIWIDHHITAIIAYTEYYEKTGREIPGIRRVDMSGCELTWAYYYPCDEMPLSLYYIGRHDIWDHSDPNALLFQYGMRLHKSDHPSDQLWELLFTDIDMVKHIVENGRVIQCYQELRDASYMKTYSYSITFYGWKCLVINSGMCNSITFKSIWDPSRYDIMLSYVQSKKDEYLVSLYTDKKEVDVSLIAKSLGGGGHKQASGFVCNKLPF